MRNYDWYLKTFEDIIDAFLDENYNSILPDDDQKEFIERRNEFEKNAYNVYIFFRSENSLRKSIITLIISQCRQGTTPPEKTEPSDSNLDRKLIFFHFIPLK